MGLLYFVRGFLSGCFIVISKTGLEDIYSETIGFRLVIPLISTMTLCDIYTDPIYARGATVSHFRAYFFKF